jgi:hypothetical protein
MTRRKDRHRRNGQRCNGAGFLQTPIALLGTLATAPGSACAALGLARLVGRNFPLVLLMVMIGALFSPTADSEVQEENDEVLARKPNGSDNVPSAMRH